MEKEFIVRGIDNLSKYLPYCLVALVLAVVVYVRIRLLTVPFERDEGEFAYMGQLLLKGIPPFTHAYTMKLPGVSIVYALFMIIFGQSVQAVHLALLVANSLSIFLVYLLARRLIDSGPALAACSTYAIISLSESVDGVFAHTTHFVVLFALAGFLLLFRFLDRRRYYLAFLSGLSFGFAFTMKQHGITFIIFALLYLVRRTWENRDQQKNSAWASGALFLAGATAPYLLIVLWVKQAGVFDQFWFWTVKYAQEYAAGPSLLIGMQAFSHTVITQIMSKQPMLWLLAIGGGIVLASRHGRCADKNFVVGLTLFSLLAISPGLVFREHYFVMLLPAASILAGMFIQFVSHHPLTSKLGKWQHQVPIFLIIIAILFGIYREKSYFFTLTPLEVSRESFDYNPFPEAIQIAKYLKEQTRPEDRIAVLGSEPEIYFYADRLSATGHIYMYGLMENQPYAEQMQAQMIREIEAARPKHVVVVNVQKSWLVQDSSIPSVLYWGEHYVRNLYDLVGVIDIIDSNTTRYLWGDEATGYTPVSGSYVTVFRRKSSV